MRSEAQTGSERKEEGRMEVLKKNQVRIIFSTCIRKGRLS